MCSFEHMLQKMCILLRVHLILSTLTCLPTSILQLVGAGCIYHLTYLAGDFHTARILQARDGVGPRGLQDIGISPIYPPQVQVTEMALRKEKENKPKKDGIRHCYSGAHFGHPPRRISQDLDIEREKNAPFVDGVT